MGGCFYTIKLVSCVTGWIKLIRCVVDYPAVIYPSRPPLNIGEEKAHGKFGCNLHFLPLSLGGDVDEGDRGGMAMGNYPISL